MRGLHVRNFFRDREGALWAGTDGDGLFRITGGHATAFTTLSNNYIRAIAQARDNSMWIATDGGLNHIVFKDGRATIHGYLVADGLAYHSTRALLIDRNGALWVGTDRGVSHIRGDKFLHDAAMDPLAQRKVWAIHEDSDGGLWFGTRDNGLYRLREGRLAHFSVDDGLASNAIYQILEDGKGSLWMSGPNGISVVNRHDLDAQADLPVRHLALTFRSIFEMEGNTEIYGGTQSSGCITAQGDVWFPTNRGPIHIVPMQRPQIMIHIDQGGNQEVTQWFFNNLQRRGVAFDVIGQSYYPWWQGSLEDLRRNLQFMSKPYYKDIVIVETAYDWRTGEKFGSMKKPFPET